ncbi:MAG: FlhC family transcriptional regulator [Burkholderiaceae bacterium]
MHQAKDCCELGARARTIHHVTGLAPRDVQRLFFTDLQTAPRGRAPDSPEWYHGANLLYRAEASIFIAIYRRLRSSGFAAGESLVGAYRHHQTFCQCPQRISFDRAFDLASHTDGIWVARTPAFSVVTCPACRSEFLATAGSVATTNDDCPFCKLVRRHNTDQRIKLSFPNGPPGDPEPILSQITGSVCRDHAADADSPFR